MPPPRRLVDYPYVVVNVGCALCPRRGRYRLARLAERHGADALLDDVLRAIAGGCRWWDERPRKYEPRCGARFEDLVLTPPPDEPPPPARLGLPPAVTGVVLRRHGPPREALPQRGRDGSRRPLTRHVGQHQHARVRLRAPTMRVGAWRGHVTDHALPHDATIRSVRERLREPESYLCGVLRRMQEWRIAHAGEDPYVAIGVMGGGRYPNYRLMSPIYGDLGLMNGFNGRSHRPLQVSVEQGRTETWSFAVMTRGEVEVLLGETRSVKRKGVT